MMSRIRLICSLLCLVVGSTVVMSQTPSAFLDKFEAEVPRLDQSFKLSKRTVTGTAIGEFAIYTWELGEQHGRIELTVRASEKAASAMLAKGASRFPVSPTATLKGLGDEAYLWQSPGSPEATILFRSGKVYVEMRGSSAAIERVARAVSESAKATAEDKRR